MKLRRPKFNRVFRYTTISDFDIEEKAKTKLSNETKSNEKKSRRFMLVLSEDVIVPCRRVSCSSSGNIV
jgi:hypothetical protein